MKVNERNFILRLQKQKEDALDYIIDRYLSLVKGIAYNVLGPLQDEGAVDECVNDIFLSIWENAGKFNGDSSDFRKWLCAIAKYRSIDYYRKVTKRKEFSTEEMVDQSVNSVEEAFIQMEDQEELIALINQLEPVDREIFILKFFLGYKTEDVSEKLGLSRTAIDNRVYRGKKKLTQKAMKLKSGGYVL
ncbi:MULTISPECIES: sigma-70 family RNA polymerase sigma factor [Sporosarcina]|uniref:Sigma-70 family RNA polymerase sigma factor n=1 Tax=Sporosarcina contaminans TaxID=633403 RepID=A0ABW3TV76_9BACL